MAKSKARYLADILQSDGSSIFVGDFSVPASFTIDPEGSPGGTVTIAGDIVSTGPAGLDNASLQNDSITLNSYEIALGNSLTLDTDDISESSPSANLWFTQARARESISLTDNGGDGSLSYNNATGEFSFTGPSAAEVRAHFSSGTGVTLSSGQISIGQPVATTDAVTFSNITTTTTSNIFYDNSISGMTATNVQSAISELNNLVGGGNVGSQASFDSYEFTATSNQTTFDLANLGISPTPGYIVGYIQVFLNGVLLAEADYNATDGQTVVLGSGAETGDILTLVVLDSFDIANLLRVTSFDASAPQNNLVIDANGNVGIGVSPNSLWRSTETVLQMPDAAFYAGNNYVAIGQNYYIPQTGGAIYEESNFASDYYQLGGNHVFRTTSSGTSGNTITWTEAMRIDSSSRVLIGQSSNTGGANADNLIVGTGSGNNGITILSGTTNGGTLAFADADADEDGFISYNHPSQFMQFGIAGEEVVRIDSSGNVGIGTSNPLVRFHARNSADGDVFYYWDNFQQAAASSLNETVTHRFYFGNVAGTDVKPAGYIQAGKDSDYSSDSNVDSFLAFGTASNDANAERMRIDSSGNVVIGSGGLDVSGIGGTYTALNMRAGAGYPILYGQTTATTTNSSAMQIVGATSGASAGGAAELLGVIQIAAESDSSTNATGYINFYTGSGGNPTERMRIASSGRVGIGTNNPQDLLHIANTGNSPAESTWLRVQNDTGLLFAGVAASGDASIQSGGNLVFNSGPSYIPALTIDSSQNVSISSGSLTLGDTSTGVGNLNLYDTGNNLLQLYGVGANDFLVDLIGTSAIGSLKFNDFYVQIDVNSGTDALTLVSSTTGTAGPQLDFTFEKAVPSNNDVVGRINFNGRDSDLNPTTYARIDGVAGNVVNGAEQGKIILALRKDANTFEDAFSIEASGGINVTRRLEETTSRNVPTFMTGSLTLTGGQSYPVGWYRLARSSIQTGASGNRGSFRVSVDSTGGSLGPGQAIITGHKDWSQTARLSSVASHGTQYFSKFRATVDSNYTYLEGYYNGYTPPTTSSFFVTVHGDTGYYSDYWFAYTENMTAGLASPVSTSDEILTYSNPRAVSVFDLNVTNEIYMAPGAGINFNAVQSTTNGATPSSAILDDYEEGTWTPTINSGTAVFSEARYTKIGNTVTLRCTAADISDATSATDINIGGIPFTPSTPQQSVGSVLYRYFSKTNATQMNPFISSGATAVTFYWSFDNGNNWDEIQFADGVQANMDMIFEITYLA